MAISSKVKLLTVPEDCAGQRIDNFLFSRFKQVPKTRVYRALRKGEVRVNGKRTKAFHKLKIGDEVRIPPPFRGGEKETKHDIPVYLAKRMKEKIFYENDALLILNKPSGIAVHGGSGIHFGVINLLRACYSDHLELVHRLDRETSGCLLIAKNKVILRELHHLLLAGQLEKKYLALLKGRFSTRECTVDFPLIKNQLSSGERFVQVDLKGKPAHTTFKVIQQFEQAVLVEVVLHTGRTHQIRVHAAKLGHPVLGDDKYGDKTLNRSMRKLGLKRLFLHAASLEFALSSEKISVCASLDNVLINVLEQLR